MSSLEPSRRAGTSPFLGSLTKACKILGLFDVENPEWTLRRMVGQTGMAKTTAFRIAKTLETNGVLLFNEATAAYHLGPAMIPLGYLIVSDVYIVRVAREYLEKLATETGETVELLVEGQRGIVVADQVSTSHPFKADLPIGRVLEGLGGSASKLFLAFQPEEKIRAALALPPTEVSSRAVTDPESLASELREIAQKGIAFGIEGRTIGVCSVSAPIVDPMGVVKAAVGVVAPTERFGVARRRRLAAAVRQTAAEISREIGAG